MSALSPARNRAALAGAVLCLTVVWIHVQDQGGFPGDTSPRYVGIGYYLLETVGVIAAVALVSAGRAGLARIRWLLAAGVALGPLTGYLLSRGPGLPGYTDDRGNWTEPLGIASLVVEGLLLALSATVLLTSRAAQQPARQAPMRDAVPARR